MIFDERLQPLPFGFRHGRALGIVALLLLFLVAGVLLLVASLQDTHPGTAPLGQPLTPGSLPGFATSQPIDSPVAEDTPSKQAPNPQKSDPVSPPSLAEGNVLITLAGDASDKLEPGTSSPIDMSFTNLDLKAVRISSLTVAIASVSAPKATRFFPCSAADYNVEVPAGFLVTVPANASATLSALGTPESGWPRVGMLNSSKDQRGCMNAVLVLHYTATGVAL